jgi:tetratricopeptide (TPR) repeat protein
VTIATLLENVNVFKRKKKPEKVLELLSKSKKRDLKPNYLYYRTKALCYMDLQNYSKAESMSILCLKKCKGDKEEINALRLLVKVYDKWGKDKKMTETIASIAELCKDDNNFYSLARCHYRAGEYTKAEIAIKKANEIQKKYAYIGFLAEILRKSKKYQEALEVIEEIPEASKIRGNYLCQAYVYICLKDINKAYDSLRKAEEIEPGTRLFDNELRLENGYIFASEITIKENIDIQESFDFWNRARLSATKIKAKNKEVISNYQMRDFQHAIEIVEKFF